MDWLEEALFGSDDDAPPPGVNEDPSFVETEPATTGSSSTTHGRRIDPIDTSTGDDDRSPPTPPSNTPSVNYTDKTTVPSTLTPAATAMKNLSQRSRDPDCRTQLSHRGN